MMKNNMETNPNSTNIGNFITNDNSSEKKSPYLIFVILVLIILLSVFVLLRNKPSLVSNNQEPVTSSLSPTSVVRPVSGSLTLTTANPTASIGQPVTLSVAADSQGIDVVGYDVLVKYDQTAFSLTNKMSNNKSFSLYSFVKDDHISLTGTKTVQVKEITAFANTKIAELTFQPKKAGKYVFTIERSIGRETSKFVDNNTKVYYPSGNLITIEVK